MCPLSSTGGLWTFQRRLVPPKPTCEQNKRKDVNDVISENSDCNSPLVIVPRAIISRHLGDSFGDAVAQCPMVSVLNSALNITFLSTCVKNQSIYIPQGD